MGVKRKAILLSPTPVHPRSVIHHGMFGNAFVKQHMVVDERWTPDSLTQQFFKMTQLLSKYAKLNALEKWAKLSGISKSYQELQKECREGRKNLKSVQSGDVRSIRNILTNHRQMQRLYQRMPASQIVDNINQRTFIMRKLRDRLENQLQNLEEGLGAMLLEKASLQNRIFFKDSFEIEELARITDLQKQVERSKVRLKAIMTINGAYKKIVEVLQSDGIFYEPILRSLDADIQDQEKFIKHILYLGSPAIGHFKEMRDKYETQDTKIRQSNARGAAELANYHKILSKDQHKERTTTILHDTVGRYVRETKSMLELKEQFEEVEHEIKKLTDATRRSDPREVYPKIKSRHIFNLEFGANIDKSFLQYQQLLQKSQLSSLQKELFINNFSEEDQNNLDRIESLKKAIKAEDEFEENTLIFNKNFSKMFVVLRYSLWNIHEIMKHVGPKRYPKISYPVDYLKLPLLKYENASTIAVPPMGFEQDSLNILKNVRIKLKMVTNAFDFSLPREDVIQLEDNYCDEFRYLDIDDMTLEGSKDLEETSDERVDKGRFDNSVLNRNQIKAESARLVEEFRKKIE